MYTVSTFANVLFVFCFLFGVINGSQILESVERDVILLTNERLFDRNEIQLIRKLFAPRNNIYTEMEFTDIPSTISNTFNGLYVDQ